MNSKSAVLALKLQSLKNVYIIDPKPSFYIEAQTEARKKLVVSG
jgi:hypothetical protein